MKVDESVEAHLGHPEASTTSRAKVEAHPHSSENGGRFLPRSFEEEKKRTSDDAANLILDAVRRFLLLCTSTFSNVW